MKKNLIKLLGAIVALATSCGTAKVIRPLEGAFLNSPIDIIVTHSGCGNLQVILDQEKPGERDITHLLDYQNGQYIAKQIELPLGIHEVWAFPKRQSAPCYATGESRRFEIVESKSCVVGKIKITGCQPLPVTLFEVTVGTRDGVELARGTSKDDGSFCVEFVPVTDKITLRFLGGHTGCGCDHNVPVEIPRNAVLSCSAKNCVDLGVIEIYCAPW